MKKNNFKGFKDIFYFTFSQSVKKTGFKVVTSLVAVLIIAIIIVLNIIFAYNNDKDKSKEEYISPIQEVYIIDESGYLSEFGQYINTNEIKKEFESTEFINVDYEDNSGLKEIWIKRISESEKKAILIYTSIDDEGFLIEACIPEASGYKESDADTLTSHMLYYFESSKLANTLTAEQLTEVMKPVITSYATIGEEQNQAAMLIKMLAPMFFGLILYFMLLLYGQTISKEVSTEKTSKLVETLLISVHPYALITGKVIALSGMAVMQFAIWIVSIIIGLFGGNAIAHMIYPEYQNSIITLIDFLRDNIGASALSIPSIILAILIFCMGFLFYSILAGLLGCTVVRPEESANAVALFQVPVIVSWLVSYIAPAMENATLTSVIRYVPFTSPFCIPVELVTGTVGIVQGLVSALILFVFSYLVITLSVRIYKGLVLYTGQKVNLKLIGKILKSE